MASKPACRRKRLEASSGGSPWAASRAGPARASGTWGHGDPVIRRSPVDLRPLPVVRSASVQDYGQIVDQAAAAFRAWRMVPAPKRGEIVRQIGTVLRWHKRDLAEVVGREVGKTRAEAEGEVQEMIDMADFAVGLSRMLYGATMPSERPGHRIYEQWHPLGPVGVITAFNFPLAVWSWNAFIAAGVRGYGGLEAVFEGRSQRHRCAAVDMAGAEGQRSARRQPEPGRGFRADDRRGADTRPTHLARFGDRQRAHGPPGRGRGRRAAGRTILELGGNNAVIVSPNADLELAARAVVFGALGTAGQRCTSIRRVLVHAEMFDRFFAALVDRMSRFASGIPWKPGFRWGRSSMSKRSMPCRSPSSG